MFSSFDKALVAAIMAILAIIEQVFGWSFGITEGWVTSIIAVITPILVWLVPNRS